MEVKVKIDKFGRILIPKKIREAKGYVVGTEFSIVSDPGTEYVTMTPINDQPAERPSLVTDEFGIPSFVFATDEVFDYDFNKAIKKDRDERGLKLPNS